DLDPNSSTDSAIPISVTAILDDLTQVNGTISIGGTETAQKAFFPKEVLPALPAGGGGSRLLLVSAQKIYAPAPGFGLPSGFRANPDRRDAISSREHTECPSSRSRRTTQHSHGRSDSSPFPAGDSLPPDRRARAQHRHS